MKNTDFNSGNSGASERHAAVERVLQQIETQSLDLTNPYSRWCELGFALVSFQEAGRAYFHRLSRFHPDYDPAECDLQFSRCLKSGGSGISLGTFFHYAKEAGISLSPSAGKESDGLRSPDPAAFDPSRQQSAPSAPAEENPEEQGLPEKLPTLPESLYENLPEFLKKAVAPAESPEERDILLLGSVGVLSSCLPTIYGIYDGFEVFPNLYLYVTAQASSGKGKLNLCKRLVLPIHLRKRKEAEEMRVLYDSCSAEEDQAGKKPQKPQEKMLLLPANSSATGIFQLLSENEGRGLIFETEGDTLSNIFKSEFGNYSDGFRKAFHHETISYYRRTDREYVDLLAPCLSTVLAGTPGQVKGLIPSAENGLFSRFLFYHLHLDPTWKDTFRNKNKRELLDYYHHLGLDFMRFYERLCKQPLTPVVLTEEQQDRFFHYFSNVQSRYLALLEDGFVATVRRMGLICYRFMMVFSALRYMDMEHLPHKITCREEDFDAAIGIIGALLRHSNYVFSHLPAEKEVQEKPLSRVLLLKALPPEFTSAEFLNIASRFGIKRTAAYRAKEVFLKEELLIKTAHGRFCRAEIKDLWKQDVME